MAKLLKLSTLHHSLYTAPRVASKNTSVSRNDRGVVDALVETHNFALANPRPWDGLNAADFQNADGTFNKTAYSNAVNKITSDIKKLHTQYFIASSFGKLSDPQLPSNIDRKASISGGILRDFIAVDYDLKTMDDALALRKCIKDLFVDKYPSKFILYPDINWPRKSQVRFVLEVSKLMDKNMYAAIVDGILAFIGVETNDYTMNLRIDRPKQVPVYMKQPEGLDSELQINNYSLYNLDGDDFDLALVGLQEDGKIVKPVKSKDETSSGTTEKKAESEAQPVPEPKPEPLTENQIEALAKQSEGDQVYVVQKLRSSRPVVRLPQGAVDAVQRQMDIGLKAPHDFEYYTGDGPSHKLNSLAKKKEPLDRDSIGEAIRYSKSNQTTVLVCSGVLKPLSQREPDGQLTNAEIWAADVKANRSDANKLGIGKRYVALDFDFDTMTQAKGFVSVFKQPMIQGKHEIRRACYPTLSFPMKPHMRVVIEISMIAMADEYEDVARQVVKWLCEWIIGHQGDIPLADKDGKALDSRGLASFIDETTYKISQTEALPSFMQWDALAVVRPEVYDVLGLEKGKLIQDVIKQMCFVASKDDKTAPFIVTMDGKPQLAAVIAKEVVPQLIYRESNQITQNAEDSLDSVASQMSQDEIYQGLSDYVKKHLADLKHFSKFWRFAEKLAAAIIREELTQETAEKVLVEAAGGNSDWEAHNKDELANQLKKLKGDDDKLKLVRSLDTLLGESAEAVKYRKYMEQVTKITTPLELYMEEHHIPADSDAELTKICACISAAYKLAVVEGEEDRLAAVYILDESKGLWTPAEPMIDELISLIHETTPVKLIKDTLSSLAPIAKRKHGVLHFYDGSQFILFLNGIYDLSKGTFIERGTLKYRDIIDSTCFSARHLHNLEYKPVDLSKPLRIMKTYTGGKSTLLASEDTPEAQVWTPERMMNQFTGGDKSKEDFLFMLLGLGLLAGHNSGINVLIKATSGAHKTTLGLPFAKLYGDHRMMMDFTELSKEFGLDNLDALTQVLWLKECNLNSKGTGGNVLSPDGVANYDSLCDPVLHFNRKHKGHANLQAPPQVYIDGTALYATTDGSTGPQRRTLLFVGLEPDELSKFTKAGEVTNINAILTNEVVVNYLVNRELYELRKFFSFDQARLANVSFTLGSANESLDTPMPEFEREWRQALKVSTSDRITEWLEDTLYASNTLIINDHNGSLRIQVLYSMYLADYVALHADSDPNARYAGGEARFQDTWTSFVSKHGLYMIGYGSRSKLGWRKVTTKGNIAIYWEGYQKFGAMMPKWSVGKHPITDRLENQ
ncbi:hypothetical protein [Lacticaseibacillus jixiensis]|uniref:hypothetical protein n=1 Tax=Lacticaseibacillus jixiensis TaxID=3231926 RepID=UPI0036F27B05